MWRTVVYAFIPLALVGGPLPQSQMPLLDAIEAAPAILDGIDRDFVWSNGFNQIHGGRTAPTVVEEDSVGL